ncbi:MLP-like protein 43 [Vicia villosa]|uniref:MLP-like protein 43 n=1 Tax=Vicia villosa TaxID=3911 RepID=UPI00273C0D89|nr:MLP-like protein 43 [Vicia villosa]
MVLFGKLSTELGIKAPIDIFFNYFVTQLHEAQVHCERVHHTKLHEGEDWHHTDTVKHWTYVIDGEVHTCYDSLEEVDEQNKKITWKLFGGDIDKHYKVFKLTLQVIDKADDGTAVAKWAIEYEKLNEDIDPPNGWMEYLSKCTRDIDAHLSKATTARKD